MSDERGEVTSPEALALCLDHVRTEVEEAGFVEASLFLDLAILSIRRSGREMPMRPGVLRH